VTDGNGEEDFWAISGLWTYVSHVCQLGSPHEGSNDGWDGEEDSGDRAGAAAAAD
jgi:hypothetical protein